MPRESRLARLLQLVLFAHVAVALAWAGWRWTASPAQALGGVALVVLLGPIVLAFECALSARANRSDARAPQAAAAQWLRSWLAESAHLYRAFAWRQPFRWRIVKDQLGPESAGRTGVVFVHGFMCNRGFWNAWMRTLLAQRRGYVAVNLEPTFGPIDGYAPALDEAVARVRNATGRPPALVCHSMGGLAARAWWRASRGSREIAALVTIGSPHAGTWMGRFSLHDNGRQMRLGSAWLQALAQDETRRPLPPATCWYSNCDNMVFPAATATLPGAANRFVAGRAHVALAFDPEVLEGTLRLLEQLDRVGQGKLFTEPAPENG